MNKKLIAMILLLSCSNQAWSKAWFDTEHSVNLEGVDKIGKSFVDETFAALEDPKRAGQIKTGLESES